MKLLYLCFICVYIFPTHHVETVFTVGLCWKKKKVRKSWALWSLSDKQDIVRTQTASDSLQGAGMLTKSPLEDTSATFGAPHVLFPHHSFQVGTPTCSTLVNI